MKLFAVIYIKHQLAAAMYLWPGATMQDCKTINAQYATELPGTPGIKSGQVKLADIRLTCEWHERNPVNNKPTG